ncbi:MAG: PfkB family carbohydrate kinase [Thermodesulfovibrionales bacterium]
MHVTGLGQCSLDYLSLVEVYPRVDTKQEVLEWHEEGGGPVATALVALSRLGISCSFHGITGDDEAGRKISQSLSDEGIDVKGLIQRKDSSSQVAFIAVEKDSARRTIFWRRPSGKALQPDELGDDFLSGSDCLLVDGLMMEVSLAAVRRAKEMNIPVLLDAGSARPGMYELAGCCDYVVASEVFADGLGWELTPQALLKHSKALGTRALTITLGERGSITAADGRIIRMPAFKVEAVDTTGAADVFHGGYIYGLLHGWDLERVVRFASAVAAMKCRQMGGRTGIPSLDEVMQFLQGQDQQTG